MAGQRSGRDQGRSSRRRKTTKDLFFRFCLGLSTKKKACTEQKEACTALGGGAPSKGRGHEQRDVMIHAERSCLPAYISSGAVGDGGRMKSARLNSSVSCHTPKGKKKDKSR